MKVHSGWQKRSVPHVVFRIVNDTDNRKEWNNVKMLV